MQQLDKIEALRQRFPLSYQEAGRVLKSCSGDLLKALDLLTEQEQHHRDKAERRTWELVEEYAKRL